MKLTKVMSMILLAATTPLLSGCNTIGQSVLIHALEDARSGDLRSFQSHFEGEALQEFGTAEGMTRFQSLSAHWENFTTSETLVQEYLGNGRHNSVYREDVFGQIGSSEPVMVGTVYVHCTNVKVWYCAINKVQPAATTSDLTATF